MATPDASTITKQQLLDQKLESTTSILENEIGLRNILIEQANTLTTSLTEILAIDPRIALNEANMNKYNTVVGEYLNVILATLSTIRIGEVYEKANDQRNAQKAASRT